MGYLSDSSDPCWEYRTVGWGFEGEQGKGQVGSKRKVKGMSHVSPVAGEERLGLWSSVPQNGWQWECLEQNNLHIPHMFSQY